MVDHPSSVFMMISDNGVRFIMVPCFSTEQEELNNSLVTTLRCIYLSDIDASDEHIEEAYAELLITGLFVSGHIVLNTKQGTSIEVEHF